MIRLAKFDNPFQPRDGKCYEVASGGNVWDLFAKIRLDAFGGALLLTIDNRHLPEEEWDNEVPDGAVIGICPKVEGGVITLIVIAIVAIAAIAIALTYSVDVPTDPSGSTPDPMYSLKGQTNQIRFGEPIESAYGRTRIWPSYGAKPYNRNISNDVWQYSLFCLGQGELEIALTEGGLPEINIEDTNIDDYEDVEYELYGPNEPVSLIKTNVQTASDVGGLELYGPNEDDYDPDEYQRVANDAGTECTRIEVDLTLPSGLYRQSKKGNLKKVTASVDIFIVAIDDAGVEDPAGWTLLKHWSKTKSTVNPRRYTVGANVVSGRYKVWVRRDNNASTSHTTGDTVVWDAMRAFLREPNGGLYGDVTMLAMKVRASSNLNDQSKRKINVVATRKLPYNGVTFATPVATRSLVAAFIDVFIAQYGAALSAEVLDLDALAELDNQLQTEGVYFDWVFDSSSSVWDAAKTIARACRGVPILGGSQVYIVRDQPRTQLQHLFNAENIVEGSFSYNISLARPEDNDSVEMEYTDPVTWKRETVVCSFPGSDEAKPDQVTMIGVTDRDRAYHEGMYMLGTQKLQREELTFSTGAEGFTATYGDYIAVEYDAFGVKGAVGGFIRSIAPDRMSVDLSVEVDSSSDAGPHKITVTGKDGSPYSYDVVAAGVSNVVLLSTPLDPYVVINLNSEPPRFIFGAHNTLHKEGVITGLSPSNDETVEVTAIVYKSAVYDYDDVDAPALPNAGEDSTTPALPVVTGVELNQTGDTAYKITWEPAVGALYYIIQVSDDPTQFDEDENPIDAWETIGNTTATFFETTILTDYIYVRVAGVNTGQGSWAYYDQLINGDTRITESTTSLPSDIRITEDGDTRVTEDNS